jgi:hypothetical protein
MIEGRSVEKESGETNDGDDEFYDVGVDDAEDGVAAAYPPAGPARDRRYKTFYIGYLLMLVIR